MGGFIIHRFGEESNTLLKAREQQARPRCVSGFRRIDNVDPLDLLKVMTGEWPLVPDDVLPRLQRKEDPGDLHREIRGEHVAEIALLKLANLIRAPGSPFERRSVQKVDCRRSVTIRACPKPARGAVLLTNAGLRRASGSRGIAPSTACLFTGTDLRLILAHLLENYAMRLQYALLRRKIGNVFTTAFLVGSP